MSNNNYYQQYSPDDPPGLSDMSPEDIDVAGISENVIEFGKSAENALPEGALEDFRDELQEKMTELNNINNTNSNIKAEELKALYQDAILQLKNSKKTVLDNLKEKELNYFTHILGTSKYNNMINLRYEKMVEQHISKYNSFFNQINKEIESLVSILKQLNKSNSITSSSLQRIRENNKKIKKHLDQTYASINTNDRKSYYINNEIGKMNIVNGIALFIYYMFFIYYIFNAFQKPITPVSVTIIVLLFLLPIAIMPFLLFLLKLVISKILNMYTSGPKNVFLNNNIYKPPKDLTDYNRPRDPSSDMQEKNINNIGFLWY